MKRKLPISRGTCTHFCKICTCQLARSYTWHIFPIEPTSQSTDPAISRFRPCFSNLYLYPLSICNYKANYISNLVHTRLGIKQVCVNNIFYYFYFTLFLWYNSVYSVFRNWNYSYSCWSCPIFVKYHYSKILNKIIKYKKGNWSPQGPNNIHTSISKNKTATKKSVLPKTFTIGIRISTNASCRSYSANQTLQSMPAMCAIQSCTFTREIIMRPIRTSTRPDFTWRGMEDNCAKKPPIRRMAEKRKRPALMYSHLSLAPAGPYILKSLAVASFTIAVVLS